MTNECTFRTITLGIDMSEEKRRDISEAKLCDKTETVTINGIPLGTGMAPMAVRSDTT